MSEEDQRVIREIRERWEPLGKEMFCTLCLEDAWRHFDRNMDRVCGSEDDENTLPHPDRGDGDILSYSAHDINKLLSIIDKLAVVKTRK